MSEQTQSRTSDDLARRQLVIYAKELQQLYQENRRLRRELQLQGPRVVGPGSRVGRYEVREEIGRGATAVVFKAYDPDLSREVAAKILHWHLNDDSGFAERFRREARSVSSLDHPNILQVYDYAEVEGSAYIVSKYVGGGTLADRLDGRLRLPEVLQYAAPLAEALDFAHRRGIVHRDVKPANVLLEVDGSPILADFGIAKIIGEGVDPTLTKWMVGTPDYISPEQVLGSTLDHRSDLYSFAIMIYRLLVGELPLRAQNEAATLLAQVYGNVVPPTEVDPELGEDLDGVLLRALSKDPNERYQTAGELAQAVAATSK